MMLDMESVFKALADPSRRKLLDLLFQRQRPTLTELAESLPAMTRFGVMKHMGLLEQAGIVTSRRAGREKLHYLSAVPMRMVHDRWIGKYRKARAAALVDLKLDMEEEMATMDARPAQIYTVFIRAPREKVWDAITRPEFTHKYFFGSEPTSPWKPGARLLWTEHGTGRELLAGHAVQDHKPRRLVHTWIVKYDAALTAEGPSRVTYELEETDGVTRLTAVHDHFAAGSKGYDHVHD